MEQLVLIRAADELNKLSENMKEMKELDAIATVKNVICVLQAELGESNYSDLVKQALSDYLSNKLMDINGTAQKYSVHVGDLRTAFAKHLEEKYCA